MHKHFEGKNPLAHLVQARQKGKNLSIEPHGTELPGHLSAGIDAAKDTAVVLVILWTLFHETTPWFLITFIISWSAWKVGRSAILGWGRLERLHQTIEEERYEIEHHRPQEKEELRALYAAKGFSGKLLDEVIDVLMADDNRLLQVMLLEELGLNLESYEHPLKQATGALVGSLGSAAIMSIGLFFLPPFGSFLCAFGIIFICAAWAASSERRAVIPSVIWNLATAALAVGSADLLAKFFL